MQHKMQEILKNQADFKSDITIWLKEDFDKSKNTLKQISEDIETIKKEKQYLIKEFDKVDVDKFISSLFFLNSKRSKKFYAWWDEKNEEAIIYKYENRKRRNRKTVVRH